MNDDELEISAEGDEEIIEEEGLRDKIKKMRGELAACRKEKEEYLTGWQRAKADFINARNDEEKSREEFLKFAEAVILKDVLSIADSLELSLKSGAGNNGGEIIYAQLKEILKRRGVTQMETTGKKFNPAQHEAVEIEETPDESKDEIVTEEMQKGWYLNGKVLRPARVKVGHFKKVN